MNQYASVVASLDMTTTPAATAAAAASGREETASSTRSSPTPSTTQAQQPTHSETLTAEATLVPSKVPEPEPSTSEYVKCLCLSQRPKSFHPMTFIMFNILALSYTTCLKC